MLVPFGKHSSSVPLPPLQPQRVQLRPGPQADESRRLHRVECTALDQAGTPPAVYVENLAGRAVVVQRNSSSSSNGSGALQVLWPDSATVLHPGDSLIVLVGPGGQPWHGYRLASLPKGGPKGTGKASSGKRRRETPAATAAAAAVASSSTQPPPAKQPRLAAAGPFVGVTVFVPPHVPFLQKMVSGWRDNIARGGGAVTQDEACAAITHIVVPTQGGWARLPPKLHPQGIYAALLPCQPQYVAQRWLGQCQKNHKLLPAEDYRPKDPAPPCSTALSSRQQFILGSLRALLQPRAAITARQLVLALHKLLHPAVPCAP